MPRAALLYVGLSGLGSSRASWLQCVRNVPTAPPQLQMRLCADGQHCGFSTPASTGQSHWLASAPYCVSEMGLHPKRVPGEIH